MKLQKGAELLPKMQRIKLGQWPEMKYDAKLSFQGIVWYRVQGGMGERGDREDWVADIPGVCISIHDYYWNGSNFGPSYKSFEESMIGELKRGFRNHSHSVYQLRKKLSVAEESLALLKNITSRFSEEAGKPINGNWQ